MGSELLGNHRSLVTTATIHHDQLITGRKRDATQGGREMHLLIERRHNHRDAAGTRLDGAATKAGH
jgi:hypothetical protein